MLDQDVTHDVVSEMRSLLEAQKSFAARLDASLESLLRRADTAAVQNLSRADELAAGLRTLALERQEYLDQTAALQQRLHDTEQILQQRVRDAEQMLQQRERDTAQRLEEMSQALAAAQAESLEQASARQRLEHENGVLQAEQQRLRRELRSLRHDVSLKEAYLVEVRRQTGAAAAEAAAEAAAGAAAEAAAEAARILETETASLREQLAQSRAEVAALNVTLRLPRYVAADELNRWLGRLRPLHAALKALAVRKRPASAPPSR